MDLQVLYPLDTATSHACTEAIKFSERAKCKGVVAKENADAIPIPLPVDSQGSQKTARCDGIVGEVEFCDGCMGVRKEESRPQTAGARAQRLGIGKRIQWDERVQPAEEMDKPIHGKQFEKDLVENFVGELIERAPEHSPWSVPVDKSHWRALAGDVAVNGLVGLWALSI